MISRKFTFTAVAAAVLMASANLASAAIYRFESGYDPGNGPGTWSVLSGGAWTGSPAPDSFNIGGGLITVAGSDTLVFPNGVHIRQSNMTIKGHVVTASNLWVWEGQSIILEGKLSPGLNTMGSDGKLVRNDVNTISLGAQWSGIVFFKADAILDFNFKFDAVYNDETEKFDILSSKSDTINIRHNNTGTILFDLAGSIILNASVLSGDGAFVTGDGYKVQLFGVDDWGTLDSFRPTDIVDGIYTKTGSIVLGDGFDNVVNANIWRDGNVIWLQFDIVAVPEPASLALLGLGAIGLLARRNRK